MDNREAVYRRAALERLTVPEELNEVLSVARPLDWLVLTAIALLCITGLLWASLARVPVTVHGQGVLEPAEPAIGLSAPASGLVTNVWMREGDVAEPGDRLLTVCVTGCPGDEDTRVSGSRGKGGKDRAAEYRDVLSPFRARVIELARPNSRTVQGIAVARVERLDPQQQVVLLVTPETAVRLRQGADAYIQAAGFPPQQFGVLSGRVSTISELPMNDDAMEQLLRNGPQTKSCIQGNLRVPVKITLTAGKRPRLSSGASQWMLSHIPVTGEILLGQEHPIAWILPWISR
jgi:hypothetical protein